MKKIELVVSTALLTTPLYYYYLYLKSRLFLFSLYMFLFIFIYIIYINYIVFNYIDVMARSSYLYMARSSY